MTEPQAKSAEPKTVSATAVHTVELPAARVLSLNISDGGELGAAVSMDESVTVFETASGRIVQTITATDLDDTQPVCSEIDELKKHIFLGLADGRIFRRALPEGDVVKGVDNVGNATDYQVVFAPETNDREGAVSSLKLSDDRRLLYFGRFNGSLSTFDLARGKLQQTERLHNSTVVEILNTSAGVVSIADNRLSKLSHRPVVAGADTANQTFKLPVDTVLNSREVIERDSNMPGKPPTPRAAPRTNPNATGINQALVGLRPSDPTLALYEHQLRIAETSDTRREIREKIVELRPELRVDEDRGYEKKQPVQTAEVPTEFDFKKRPMQRVVMALSSDGSMLAVGQARRTAPVRIGGPTYPVTVWEAPSATRIRTWQTSSGLSGLSLALNAGYVLPQPLSGKMSLFDGRLIVDASLTSMLAKPVSSCLSPQSEYLAIGTAGVPGMARTVVRLSGIASDYQHDGVEAFEGVASALAWSADGRSLFAAVRERTQSRLLELESPTLNVRAEIDVEPMTGTWNVDAFDAQRSVAGATHLLPSPDGKILVTYGHHTSKSSPYQIRYWRKSNEKWPQDNAKVVDSKQPMLETNMTGTPMVFVNQQSSQLAVVGKTGFAVIDGRSGSIVETQELPDVGGRRPATLLSSDGRWALAGDRDGNVWVWELRALDRKPRSFAAQAGPITGLAMSPNAKFLATAGEENRVRVWDVSTFLGGPVRSSKRER